jgi:hypothetical protein
MQLGIKYPQEAASLYSLFPSPFSLFLRHLSHLFCHFPALSGISKLPMLKMVFTESRFATVNGKNIIFFS